MPALLNVLKGEAGLQVVHFSFYYFIFDEQARVLALVNLVEVTQGLLQKDRVAKRGDRCTSKHFVTF